MEKSVYEVAAYIANLMPEAFTQHPMRLVDETALDFDLERDFSEHERQRYNAAAAKLLAFLGAATGLDN